MKTIREQFEEIWPVPEGIYWHGHSGEYMQNDQDNENHMDMCMEWDARLDTFTRCQETTAMYVGLIEELVDELEKAQDWIVNDTQSATVSILLTGAKQIMEQKK